MLQAGRCWSSIRLCSWTVYSDSEVIWNFCSASVPNSGLFHTVVSLFQSCEKNVFRHTLYFLLNNSTNFKSANYWFMRHTAATHVTVMLELYSPPNLFVLNPLNPKLNPVCYLLALLGAHHFLHVSRIRVKSLTFRLLMSYIYGAPILDVNRSHTAHHSQ